MKFEDLGLAPEILTAISRMGFETPTPVQEKVIPRLLKNEGSLVALAQTGTGKTAAFGLPILSMLDSKKRLPQALVLCPTRELCVQITRDMVAFAACSDSVKTLAVYGGTPIQTQLRALQRGVQIIVATPGRMHDIIRRKSVDLSGIDRVVLDEADEMLNMGFQEDLEAILSGVPDEAHTLLFSATMPRQVANMAKNYMKDAEEITVGQRNAGAENVSHECYVVHQRDRYNALKRLADFYPDMYAIVFCRTRQDTQTVAGWLMRDGYNADAIHGDLTQVQRDRVMANFRAKSLQILVATDVAARGLDVNDLTHVINYNLPDDLSSYTHRSGRTGRAGKSGVSVVIINMREKGLVRRMEKIIRKQFKYRDVPSGREICEAQLISMINRMKSVDVNHEQIDEFLPSIQESLKDMDRDELVKRFVSLEFNNLLDYYKKAVDLSPGDKPGSYDREPRGRSDRGSRGRSDRESRGRGDRASRGRGDRESRGRSERPARKDAGDRRVSPPAIKSQRMFLNLGTMDGFTTKKLTDLMISSGCDVPVRRMDVMKKYSFFDVPAKDTKKVMASLGVLHYDKRDVRVEPVDDEMKGKRLKRAEHRKGAEGEKPPRRYGKSSKRQSGSVNFAKKSRKRPSK